MNHPDRDALLAHAEAPDRPGDAVALHLQRCAACRASLDSLRARLAGIEALPLADPPPRDRWPDVVAGIRASGKERGSRRSQPVEDRPGAVGVVRLRWMPSLAVAAVALLVFLAGVGAGRASLSQANPPAGIGTTGRFTLAAEVQRAGSEYVNQLASVRWAGAEIPLKTRIQAREAAVAAIWAGARELQAMSPADPDLDALVAAAAASRYGDAPPSPVRSL